MTLDPNAVFLIIWFIVILIAAFIEATTMDLTSVWFAVGALIAFILGLLQVSVGIQVAVFFGSSIILLLSVRPIAKNYFKTNIVGTNADRLVGKVGSCTKEIPAGGRGEVKIHGSYWSAISSGDDIVNVDDKVEVLAIEGNKLIVVKV